MNEIEIIIEVGTEEEKKIIKEELECIVHVIKVAPWLTNIRQIVIPIDFETKVHALEGTTNCRACRGHNVAAKHISLPEGSYLVYSLLIFKDGEDFLCRMLIYFHEYFHAVNHYRFCCAINTSEAYKIYHDNFRFLFDEYCCNRMSIELIDILANKKTKEFVKCLSVRIKRLYQAVQHIDDKYDRLRTLVGQARNHRDINKFINESCDLRDEILKEVSYLFSFCDAISSYALLPSNLIDSKLERYGLKKLISTFRQMYRDVDVSLLAGVDVMAEVMMSTGVKYEDRPQGLWGRFVDI